MTTAQRRRARKARLASHIAAGTFVARKPRSHYLTVDIRDAVQSDLEAMRVQMRAQRDRLNDREWAFRPEKDVPGRIALFEGLNLPVRGPATRPSSLDLPGASAAPCRAIVHCPTPRRLRAGGVRRRDLELLGLDAIGWVPEEEVRAAFRRKCLSAHPDHGGSTRKFMTLMVARDRVIRAMTYGYKEEGDA